MPAGIAPSLGQVLGVAQGRREQIAGGDGAVDQAERRRFDPGDGPRGEEQLEGGGVADDLRQHPADAFLGGEITE